MARFAQQNRPVIDDEGFTLAQVAATRIGQGVDKTPRKDEHGDLMDPITWDRFELDLVMQGVTKPIDRTIHAGVRLAPKGTIKAVGGKEKEGYNRLTTIALRLGIVSESDVETGNDPISDETIERLERALLNDLPGKWVRFKLGKQKVSSGSILVPMLDTLEWADDPAG